MAKRFYIRIFLSIFITLPHSAMVLSDFRDTNVGSDLLTALTGQPLKYFDDIESAKDWLVED